MTREVTERDFRMPEFADAKVEDYELREGDDKVVRKDRWKTAIMRIRSLLGDTRRNFEIDDVVNAVSALVANIERPPEDEDDE